MLNVTFKQTVHPDWRNLMNVCEIVNTAIEVIVDRISLENILCQDWQKDLALLLYQFSIVRPLMMCGSYVIA